MLITRGNKRKSAAHGSEHREYDDCVFLGEELAQKSNRILVLVGLLIVLCALGTLLNESAIYA
jgi:hypothetical protein